MFGYKYKIEQTQTYLEQLFDIVPKSFEEYEKDFKTKNACERLFQKIAEAVVDISFLFTRLKKYPFPDEEDDIFDILANKRVISMELAKKLKGAKSMRNIIVHEYGEVDDAKVFDAIKEEFEKDISKFIQFIDNNLNEENKI